ncbi:hypothetical protein CJ179_38615 [Rhodococcus sp. ACS1]|uniref:hypothetical protein n=1 Tax=Rhodococcus sp. ACS1 TaxID=2028570 RepID=UPI000BB153A7|nr:hypothetical protein [Rhodococcus sp. ACS1]PBC38514.1 hypothetical protein CJ179_38615 [Rhodococcus sp. ACS1]
MSLKEDRYEVTTHEGEEIVVFDCRLWWVIRDGMRWSYYLDDHPEDYDIPGLKKLAKEFELYVTSAHGQDADYDGQDRFHIIRRLSDDKLFGFDFYHSGGKYGEAFIDSNGGNFDIESHENPDYDEDYDGFIESEDVNPDWVDYYVFREVSLQPLEAYGYVN